MVFSVVLIKKGTALDCGWQVKYVRFRLTQFLMCARKGKKLISYVGLIFKLFKKIMTLFKI